MAGRAIKEHVMYVDAPAPRRDVVVVEEERFRSPPPRYHSPSSDRIVKVEPERHYYTEGRTTNRYHQRGHSEHYTHGYGTSRSLGCRRCCVALVAGLILLGLAGLAVGLYFAITGAQQQATANLPENNVQNGYKGYYVNGVYVVPVTTKPSETYLIYGVDMPCNPNNDNGGVTESPYYPDCNEVLPGWGFRGRRIEWRNFPFDGIQVLRNFKRPYLVS